jgi:hypothetical protein
LAKEEEQRNEKACPPEGVRAQDMQLALWQQWPARVKLCSREKSEIFDERGGAAQ